MFVKLPELARGIRAAHVVLFYFSSAMRGLGLAGPLSRELPRLSILSLFNAKLE